VPSEETTGGSVSNVHLSDSDIALRALGEMLDASALSHLHQCPRCAAEVDQLAAVVSTAKSLSPEDAPQDPPPHVWEGIETELALQPEAPETSDDGVEPGTVVALTRRRWSSAMLVAASIAGILVGGTAAVGLSSMLSDDTVSAPVASVVASTTLAALPDHEGSGDARIVDTPRGQELIVDVANLTSSDGFYEVWLINPDTFEMVGLGALNGANGRFAIPDGLDLSQYRVVDVSSEPFDGDPKHSSDSVVRGELSI
jgi:hypothetical protein